MCSVTCPSENPELCTLGLFLKVGIGLDGFYSHENKSGP